MSNTDLVATYNYWVVALSVVVSIVAAYAARSLSERVSVARGPARAGWLAVAAVVSGLGIWSMHYTGMLALQLPIPVRHYVPNGSLLVGVAGCAAAQLILGLGETGWRVVGASILMGAGAISGLHFTAMSAMRLQAIDHHSPVLVSLSVVLAILISWMALSLSPDSRPDSPHRRLRYHGSALLGGAANPVMHYTAMAAVTFTSTSAAPDLSQTVGIGAIDTVGITVVPLMVLVVAMLTSLADRLQKQKALLDELFEQAPQAVVLLDEDDRVVRMNREFSLLFGYTPEETLGRRLSELIVPEDLPDEAQRYRDLGARRERVETEGVRIRKDGSRLYVSIVRVPVLVPHGKFEMYGFYHDITGRLQAAQERQRTLEQLRALAARLQSVREEERTSVAREIHDELGQSLTAIKIDLASLIAELPPDRQPKPERAEALLKLADEAIQSVRRISAQLRPGILDDLGLVAALEWAAEEFETRTGIKCRLDRPQEDIAIDRDRATALFRIFQETLTNVARHADATEVNVRLGRENGNLVLGIRDNGIGVSEERLSAGTSLGILGMRERALLLGGELTIHGEVGKGTQVTVRIQENNRIQPGQNK